MTVAEPEVLAPLGSGLIPLSIQAMKERRAAIDKFVKECLEVDTHYGTIPGTNKPTLLKPGAELMCSFFCLAPKFFTEDLVRDGEHLTLTVRCEIYTYGGTLVGSGRGTCSTKEKKYAWRKAQRACPTCGAETIFTSRKENEPGYYCWRAKGGCGAKFPPGDAAIEGQPEGRVANEDIADSYNTVQKMGDKRALIAAVLITLGVSDKFTQDLDEIEHAPDDAGGSRPAAPQPRPAPQAQRPAQGNGQPRSTQAPPPQQKPPAATKPAGPDPFADKPATNGAEKPAQARPSTGDDVRPGIAQEILGMRSTFPTPPSPAGWAKIVTYFLGRPTPDTIYGDGILAHAEEAKLRSLHNFVAALYAGDDSAIADLTDIIQGRDPKARGAQS